MTNSNFSEQGIPSSAAVVGGSGFIGRHLSRYLVDMGCAVTTLDITPTPAGSDIPHQIWDVRTAFPKDLIDAPEVIFNLAAVHRSPGHQDREYYQTNVAGALHVTEWAEKLGVNTICFTSSTSVYGPTEEPREETSPLCPISPYGDSKVMAEKIHERWARQDPIRLLKVIRPAVTFGPGEQGNFTRLARALKSHRFVYPGRKDTLKACGYVDDLVKAMVFSLSHGRNMLTWNVCYPDPYSIEDVCQAFHDVAGYRLPMGVPDKLLTIPLPMLRGSNLGALSYTAWRVEKLRVSTNIRPLGLIDAGFKWETDLVSGLERWHKECGDLGFV